MSAKVNFFAALLKIIFIIVMLAGVPVFCGSDLTAEVSLVQSHDPAHPCEHDRDTARVKFDDILKVGGQARVRGEHATNQNLGDFSYAPDTDDEQIISRTRLNFSVKPAEQIKGFIQGQFYLRENRSDYSKANLYQAYVELEDAERFPLSLKIGRQDFCYGSTFFLGPNDFYDGLTWDAAKLRYAHEDKFWIDVIGARYVRLSKNTSDAEPALYGAYSSYALAKDANLDLYFFYHKGGFQFFHSDLQGGQKWWTLGTRLAGKIKEQFDYEVEPLYQFGKINSTKRSKRDDIRAFGGHVEGGYTFESKYKPRIFGAYAFATGDSKASDKKYKEFHGNIYNDNYLVGDMSVIGDLSGLTVGSARASGMHILTNGMSVDLHPKLNLNFDWHYFRADKTPVGVSKRLGNEANLIAAYKLMENLNIIASANRYFTGKFFEDAGGSAKDINYFYVQTQVEF